MVAASSKLTHPGGIGTMVRGEQCTHVPRLPTASPNTGVPGAWPAPPTTTPEQSPPGSPGSPGYMPSTLSTSLKLSPTARTATDT
eukprot:1149387-Pelagomonas_calceolata.AAC.9